MPAGIGGVGSIGQIAVGSL